MSGFVVARLTPNDWQEFRDLRLAALTDAPSAFSATLASQQNLSEQEWRQKLDQRTQFMVRSDGTGVGTAGCWVGENGAELIAMWVHPNWRGQGVGNLLVRAVLDRARELGLAEVRLWVTEGNQAAERLYTRNGFVQTGESQPIHPGDPQLREFAMRCPL